MYLVYKTDCQHSYNSRDLIGLATSQAIAIKICRLQATKEGEKISKTELFNLSNIMQTQGYSGDGEFQFEEVKTNQLI